MSPFNIPITFNLIHAHHIQLNPWNHLQKPPPIIPITILIHYLSYQFSTSSPHHSRFPSTLSPCSHLIPSYIYPLSPLSNPHLQPIFFMSNISRWCFHNFDIDSAENGYCYPIMRSGKSGTLETMDPYEPTPIKSRGTRWCWLKFRLSTLLTVVVLVITEKGPSDLVCYYLSKAGVIAIRRLRKADNNRIAKACETVVVNRPDELQESDARARFSWMEWKETCRIYVKQTKLPSKRRRRLAAGGEMPPPSPPP